MVKSGQSDLENGRLGLFNDHPNCDVIAQTLPCPRSNLGYPKSEFRFGTSQTGISILDDLSQI